MKALLSKQELADVLGMSRRSLTRFLLSRENILTNFGYSRMAQLIPRKAVSYVLAELGVPENGVD